MAKARVSINPMYAGGAGGYSFYVRGGEQVVRQRKNNSNYGETASRSEAQMRRRVKWGNLVNLFKEMKSWQPKAYDGKLQGQTDYNLFMSLNINSSQVCLTKDQARNGCAVMDAYQVSRGSIPPITTVALVGGQKAKTDITITATVSATRTVGNLSADIIANNPQFKNGDNIAVVAWSQFVDSRSYPYVVSAYMELTLDTSSVVEVGSLDVFDFLDTTAADAITIFPPGSSFGSYTHVVAIHTRKGESLQVSTQKAVALSTAVSDQFSTYEWQQTCIESYGLDETVPLDPFDGASGSGGLSTTYSHTFSGNGNTVVLGPSVKMVPGNYLFRFNPSSWAVTETVDNNAVADILCLDSSNHIAAESYILRDDLTESSLANGLRITVPVNASTVIVRLRADDGVTVAVSGTRQAD